MNPGTSGSHHIISSVVSSSSSAHNDQRGHGIIKDETDSDMYDDDDDDDEEGMNIGDENITSQLASAGPTGMAAAAAISSTKKRKRSHAFETNPSIRKRQQTRLLRKLKQNIEEYSLRVGQQAVVLVATPGGKSSQVNFRAFGAKPLEDVVKNLRAVIMTELETALAQQAPPTPAGDPSRYELPPLVIEGIPTPVEKMTQAQLRAFIPLMLKYSTGRGKPGWGKDATKPPWWPKGVPWANVRMDARKHDEKQKVSWTHALRQIVTNCYEFHGRQDLLPSFEEDGQPGEARRNSTNEASGVETKPVNVRLATTAPSNTPRQASTSTNSIATTASTSAGAVAASASSHFPATMVQTISNPDGTVSIIQVDPSNPIITLPDGTQAIVEGGHQALQAVTELSGDHQLEVNGTGEIQAPEGSQILIASEDGQAYPVQAVQGMITVPVGTSMYQAVLQGQGLTVDNGQVQVIGGPIQLATSNGVHHLVKLDQPCGGMVKVEQEPAVAAASAAGTSSQTYQTQKPPGSGTLTITPVGSSTVHHHPASNPVVTTAGAAGSVLQIAPMVAARAAVQAAKASAVTSTTGKQCPQSPARQPDTTESVD